MAYHGKSNNIESIESQETLFYLLVLKLCSYWFYKVETSQSQNTASRGHQIKKGCPIPWDLLCSQSWDHQVSKIHCRVPNQPQTKNKSQMPNAMVFLSVSTIFKPLSRKTRLQRHSLTGGPTINRTSNTMWSPLVSKMLKPLCWKIHL